MATSVFPCPQRRSIQAMARVRPGGLVGKVAVPMRLPDAAGQHGVGVGTGVGIHPDDGAVLIADGAHGAFLPKI
ncbi:hypothetical protein GCM10009691_21340 [Brevibacterium picturae]|uniref:Uncharacterized protein n=1 Tax=Brevibacterium picturae TaxID=260553 RepID=A0ABP4MLR4_9MICO